MKRLLLTACIALLAAGAFAAKSKLTIKNTVGADLDELGDYDLYTRTKTEDISGATKTDSALALGNQFQIDFESQQLDARLRLEALYTNADEAESSLLLAPSGYLHYSPAALRGWGLAAGNNFFKHFAIPSAYLAASDDTTKYGRLLTDSLSADHYFGNDSISLYSNGFAGGLTGSWQLGSGGDSYLKLAAGATCYPGENAYSDGNDRNRAVDFGLNGGIGGLLDFGFTAHNFTDADRKFGLFAGLVQNPDLVANLGFYYNFTDSDYLPEDRVTRSDDETGEDSYKYKKQSTKYALGISGGYNFRRIGLGLYADCITGLTNEYIGEIKYYDENGNLIKTETATIVRDGTIVKYKLKDGVYKAKRTDEYSHQGIPFYSQIRLTYLLTDNLEAACSLKLRTLLHADGSSWLTVYPRCTLSLPALSGSITAGLRLDMNSARADGLTSLSLPLSYTYKFKKKYK